MSGKKNILLLLPPEWEPDDVFVCVDPLVSEPTIIDKDAMEFAPNPKLELAGEFLVPKPGVIFYKAKVT